MLCFELDYVSAIWALKSFYHFARVRYSLAIHLQGRANARMVARLGKHFPDARLITQKVADSAVEPWLNERGLRYLLTLRRNNPLLLQLVDFYILAKADHVLGLDSDVLFFRRPAELLLENSEPLSRVFFQKDCGGGYDISEEEAHTLLGITLLPCLNNGIRLFARSHLSLKRCDDYLALCETLRERHTGLVAQTLHALEASEQKRASYLPGKYLLTLEDSPDWNCVVARHYAGGSRRLLTAEGMARLIGVGFLDQLRASSSLAYSRFPIAKEQGR